MKQFISMLVLIQLVLTAIAQNNSLTPELQIKSALLAAPADKRSGVAVYGYSPAREIVLLRKGTNELICLADDPAQEGFSAACYHKELEPFMQRGRDLKKQGKSVQETFNIRETEAKAGKLHMPKQPATLIVYTAAKENYNSTTGEVKDAYMRYVVYIPYATAESTGLPLKPEGPGMPWIMHPGTHGAHIMINPPKTK